MKKLMYVLLFLLVVLIIGIFGSVIYLFLQHPSPYAFYMAIMVTICLMITCIEALREAVKTIREHEAG